jgi:alpha-tubulin suppressor-like RCC1 family protein
MQTEDGNLVCWGNNGLGQSTPPAPTWTFIQVTAGESHTCGVRPDGAFVCWGANTYGQVDMIFKDGF